MLWFVSAIFEALYVGWHRACAVRGWAAVSAAPLSPQRQIPYDRKPAQVSRSDQKCECSFVIFCVWRIIKTL